MPQKKLFAFTPFRENEFVNVEIIIGYTIGFFLRAIALLTFLWIMIKIQKFDYEWLPLIGSAFLASGLDMIPYVGHFIAVPVLYYCIWKITRSTIFPDAAFTVILSYALMRCLGWILLTVQFSGFHATSAMDAPAAEVVSTNQIARTVSTPADKIAKNIFVKGISKGADSAMVTIQYGTKNYILSLNEPVSISTDEGLVTVNFVEAGADFVTLTIRGEKVKYAVK